MFLSPKTAIEKGWIRFPENFTEEQKSKAIQPNAIDFTLDRVFYINGNNTFVISENLKKMRGGIEKTPVPLSELNGELGWRLAVGERFDCLSDYYVNVPEGVAALMVTRSTFVRNGMFWISGLFDSGFEGHIGGVLHNRSGAAVVAKGTRVGQIIFVASESVGVYAGGWNHAQGTHYTEVK